MRGPFLYWQCCSSIHPHIMIQMCYAFITLPDWIENSFFVPYGLGRSGGIVIIIINAKKKYKEKKAGSLPL